MKIFIFIALFILGGLFISAAHIPVWLLSGKKPTHNHWQLYGIIGTAILALILILANTIL